MTAREIWSRAGQLIGRYGNEAADIATLRAMALSGEQTSRDWFAVARAVRDLLKPHSTEILN